VALRIRTQQGTFKQHSERLQIAVHGLCGNLADQSLSKSYNILFRDLAHGFILLADGELQKLVQTSLIKSDGRQNGLPAWP
jgi:hypothetical protein